MGKKKRQRQQGRAARATQNGELPALAQHEYAEVHPAEEPGVAVNDLRKRDGRGPGA